MALRRVFPAFVVAAALAIVPFSLHADDFSTERLREGEGALRAKRFPEAVDQLRIACFGLLSQPELLSEGLVHLALAQDGAGRNADVLATLNRFLEVERRFTPYGKARVDEETRLRFHALLVSRIPAEVLAAYPTVVGPVRPPTASHKDP